VATTAKLVVPGRGTGTTSAADRNRASDVRGVEPFLVEPRA